VEKRESVNQKAKARFERARSYLLAHPALFAAQGTVAATWRAYRGRRLGPYFQVSWRESGRQRWLYLGRCQELAGRIRDLLARLQRRRRHRRLVDRLEGQVRSSLRRWKRQLKQRLAAWGIQLKGFEFRGARKALARYAEACYCAGAGDHLGFQQGDGGGEGQGARHERRGFGPQPASTAH
jgi:hypothetical protein